MGRRGTVPAMMRLGRRLGLLLLAAALCAPLAGCFGVSSNPSYFPYLLPFGDVIPTHGKPIWPGYDANFDPAAHSIVLMPLEATSRVRTQHVMLATVYDEKCQPLRNRRVEWKIEGVGSLIEVDEHGIFPGRGYEFGKYGVSYTRLHEYRITRGNANLTDDFMVRPGQTYCVLTSPIEGDTHLTAYAPGIHDWDKRVVHTTIRWVDVNWEFPPRGLAKFGTEHVFNTRISRFTDRRPLQGYEVRYKILDGPPAFFLPNRTQEFIVRSNADGDAQARIVQVAPVGGINRVSVDILRPPDPTTPSGAVVPIASGETSVEWLAPNVSLSHTAPPTAPINQEVVFTTTVTNTGRVESRGIFVTVSIPDGLQFVRANPPPQAENQLVWTLAGLAPGQSYTIQTVYAARKPGPATGVASMSTGEGQKDQKEATTTVTIPDLRVDLQGPPAATVNVPVKFQITLNNPGSAVLENVLVDAQFDEGLQHSSGAQKLTLGLGGAPIVLAPQQSQTVELELTPRKKGPLGLKVTAKAAGLTREKAIVVVAQEPKLSLEVIEGPQKRFAGRPGEWKIKVANEGDIPLTNVTLRDRLPPELEFEGASDNGQPVLGEVTWNLGTLEPRSQRIVAIKAKATRPAPVVTQMITATAEPGVRQETQKGLEILGLGALATNLKDLEDPVEVGKPARYQLEITNTGTAPVAGVTVRAVASAELQPLKALGPGAVSGVVQGQTTAFGKVDSLAPGAKLVYTFETQAQKAGDARFEVQITTDGNPDPLTVQEATRIVAPLPGPGGNAPAPPPGGGTVKPLPPE
jgi:uncharacterized repeat protein (TIGR01451 family)